MRGKQLPCVVWRDVQLRSQFAFAHAIHDAKVHDLRFLTADPCDVSHHLVQVHITRVVFFHDFIDQWVLVFALQASRKVNQ